MRKKILIILVLILLSETIQASPQQETNTKWRYFGQASPRSVLLGMWTTHLWTNEFGALQANNLIGLVGYGLFVGSFTNSYTHRSYAAGINRYWYSKQFSENSELQLGYRLGLIYGYKKDEVLFSSSSPVIPFVQLISDFSWKRIGVEISTTGQVISAGFFVKF